MAPGTMALGLATLTFLAGIPDQDSRKTEIRGPNTHFTMPRYASRAAWEARKAHLRMQILSAAGLLPMPVKTPLNPKIWPRIRGRDYTVDAVLLETLPGYYLGGNLYRPISRGKEKFPAVLSPHGHWKHGRLENQESYSVPALGINLARQGYVVFAHDMVGYNDTTQTGHSFGGDAEKLWSFTPMGLQLWNSIRALDFLQSLDEVNPRRIAVTGASGGGTQTFLLAAVDRRVRFSAPVNMVSASMQGGDPCEEAPNLRLGTFNVEFAALMAPRPMLLVSATGDWTRNTPREEFPAIRRIYELYGAADRVSNVHFDAKHNYNRQSREAVYARLARAMGHDVPAAAMEEQPVDLKDGPNLLALTGGWSPPNALSYSRLFQQWKSAAQRQTEETRDSNALRTRLTYALGAEWPSTVLSAFDGSAGFLSRAGSGDRIPAFRVAGRGDPVLVVHPEGIGGARQTAAFNQAVRAGRPVLTIDAFQTGSAKHPRNGQGKYFLSYNRTDYANRVQDILTALRFLGSQSLGRIQVVGAGSAGIWCLFAAAVAPVELSVLADLDGFSGSDADFVERFFVPGIQRAGGLPAALRLVERFRTDF